MITFSWITLPLLSTLAAYKAVSTGIMSCCNYFKSIIHFYLMIQRVRGRERETTWSNEVALYDVHQKWNSFSYPITLERMEGLFHDQHNGNFVCVQRTGC